MKKTFCDYCNKEMANKDCHFILIQDWDQNHKSKNQTYRYGQTDEICADCRATIGRCIMSLKEAPDAD